MNVWINQWMSEWTKNILTNKWMSELTNERVSEWMTWINEWMDGWMNEWMMCGYISEIQVINNWIGKSQIICKKHSDQIMKFTKQGIYCHSVHSVGMSFNPPAC